MICDKYEGCRSKKMGKKKYQKGPHKKKMKGLRFLARLRAKTSGKFPSTKQLEVLDKM